MKPPLTNTELLETFDEMVHLALEALGALTLEDRQLREHRLLEAAHVIKARLIRANDRSAAVLRRT